MYEFFWFDFADWYIEIAKSRLYTDDADSKRCAQVVLAYVLEVSTRLWHPFIPYVTERLWKTIPHQGDALMSATWPANGQPRCEAARTRFDILKQIVSAVRNARSEYNVEISKKVAAVLCIEDSSLRDTVTQELASICLLAKIDSTAVSVRPVFPCSCSHGCVSELLPSEHVTHHHFTCAGRFTCLKRFSRRGRC